MDATENCINFINIYKKDGSSFEDVLKNLIASGHMTVNDVEYNQQIVIKTEKNGGI